MKKNSNDSKNDVGHPRTLQHFHECENCRANGDIRAATSSVGEFMMSRMSEREMAMALTSLTLVLCEEQLGAQDAAFEDFVQHLRVVWTASAAERRARLTEVPVEDKSNLH
jgi:ribosomal protein S14